MSQTQIRGIQVYTETIDSRPLSASAITKDKLNTDIVAINPATGKIKGLTSTYLENLDGSNLTGIVATEIADNSVSTSKLQNNAVTADKLASSLIDSERAVTTNHIRDSAIINSKIATGAISDTHISSSANISFSKLEAIPLKASNNLSDVTNIDTARANIGAAKSGDNTDITSLTSPTGVLSISGKLSVDSSNNYAKLTVYNSSYDWTIGVEDPRDNYGHWIRWTENGIEQWVLGAVGTNAGGALSNAFALKSGNPIAWRLVITQSGNVGINTTNPQSPLYVVGDITSTTNITGNNVTANNNLIAGAGTVIGVRSSDVSSGSQSLIYFNSTDNQVKLWNGSSLTILG